VDKRGSGGYTQRESPPLPVIAQRFVLAVLLVLPFVGARVAAQTAAAVPVPSGTLFDGSKTHEGDVSGPREAASPASGSAAAADPDGLDAKQRALLDGLLARVELKPGADPRAPAVLHQTFVTVVRTPTGAEMAARFIAENARAIVQFGGVQDSAVTIVNGKAVLLYSGGNTDTSKRPPVVSLNPGYLDADPAWRGSEMADTLGHEMFGHALERQRADKAGITDSLGHYRGDEANAGLLGWLIGVEAGGPTDNGHMWNYLRDPEEYHKTLETTMAYYAGTFSVEDMKDPLATLQARRDRVGQARERLKQQREVMDAWGPVVEHFVKIHGMRREDFGTITENIDRTDSYTATEDAELDRTERYIDTLSTHWRTDQAQELAAISREADSPYYVGTEQRLQVLRERLKELTADRKPEPSIPPVPGRITWSQLAEMYEQDKKDHPEHWSR
jgi:hypothetical protein